MVRTTINTGEMPCTTKTSYSLQKKKHADVIMCKKSINGRGAHFCARHKCLGLALTIYQNTRYRQRLQSDIIK